MGKGLPGKNGKKTEIRRKKKGNGQVREEKG